MSQSLWHLGLPQTIELGNTNNIIMTNFSRHYLVSIDGYDVGIERMEFLLDGSFSAFGMGKMDRSIIYWGVLLENGEGNGVNEILIGYEIDALNLAASLALRNPLELYGFPSVVYTTIITVVYIYKKRHIQIVDETYPRMRKDD